MAVTSPNTFSIGEIQSLLVHRYGFDPKDAAEAAPRVVDFFDHIPSGDKLTQNLIDGFGNALATRTSGNFRYFVSRNNPNFNLADAYKELSHLESLSPANRRAIVANSADWQGLEQPPVQTFTPNQLVLRKMTVPVKVLTVAGGSPMLDTAGTINLETASQILGRLEAIFIVLSTLYKNRPSQPFFENFVRRLTQNRSLILTNLQRSEVQSFLTQSQEWLITYTDAFSTETSQGTSWLQHSIRDAAISLTRVLKDLVTVTLTSPATSVAPHAIADGFRQGVNQSQGMPLWQKGFIVGGVIVAGLTIYFWDDLKKLPEKIEKKLRVCPHKPIMEWKS